MNVMQFVTNAFLQKIMPLIHLTPGLAALYCSIVFNGGVEIRGGLNLYYEML